MYKPYAAPPREKTERKLIVRSAHDKIEASLAVGGLPGVKLLLWTLADIYDTFADNVRAVDDWYPGRVDLIDFWRGTAEALREAADHLLYTHDAREWLNLILEMNKQLTTDKTNLMAWRDSSIKYP